MGTWLETCVSLLDALMGTAAGGDLRTASENLSLFCAWLRADRTIRKGQDDENGILYIQNGCTGRAETCGIFDI